MRILFHPQVSLEENFIEYEFTSSVVKVKMIVGEETFHEVLDFTGLPNGEIQLLSEDGEDLLDIDMPRNPLVSAKKEQGVLYIELLNWISEESTEEERFPDWIDHTEYEDYIKRNLYNPESDEEKPPLTERTDISQNRTNHLKESEHINIEEVDF